MKPHAKRYFLELGGAMVGYGLALVGSLTLLRAHPDTPLRVPLALLPMIPAAFAVVAVLRFVRASDELERRIQLEAMTFAFACTALTVIAYGFLEGNAGFPHVNVAWVWPAMAVWWVLGVLLGRRRYR
jgi:hypothetical protein